VGNNDTLKLGAGITAAGTTVTSSGYNVTLSWGTDSVTISNYLIADYYKVETIAFADGTKWTSADIAAKLAVPTGTIVTTNGTAGADVLMGNTNSQNRINGLAGDDFLLGGNFADTINGGQGNDTLYGSAGNDTYLFARGDGADAINDMDATVGNTDVLQFSDVAASQLWFARNGASNDLQINVIGSNDSVTVKNWFLSSMCHVEQIKTSDGMTLVDTQVANMIQAMAAFNVPAAGQTSLPIDYQTALAPAFAANWHKG
jgi:Ca2+-binding RTX toxin-like protein